FPQKLYTFKLRGTILKSLKDNLVNIFDGEYSEFTIDIPQKALLYGLYFTFLEKNTGSSFKEKYRFWNVELKNLHLKYFNPKQPPVRKKLVVNRNTLFHDAFRKMMKFGDRDWKSKLYIVF